MILDSLWLDLVLRGLVVSVGQKALCLVGQLAARLTQMQDIFLVTASLANPTV